MKTKICKKCNLELPLDDEHFASRYDRKEKTYQWICRKCQAEYRKLHYQKNKQKYIDKAKKFTKSMVDWFFEYKKGLKCKVCGENRYWVLDFHHRDKNEKEIEISSLYRNGNRKKLLKEIEKCDVLCANCHRDLHFKERQADFA
jgi:hypothetical protein